MTIHARHIARAFDSRQGHVQALGTRGHDERREIQLRQDVAQPPGLRFLGNDDNDLLPQFLPGFQVNRQLLQGLFGRGFVPYQPAQVLIVAGGHG